MKRSRLRGVFAVRGIKRLLACALLAELPAGMTALAIVLRITQAGGTYARAGLISGVGALGVGVSAPLWSRLVDRRGQAVALVPTAAAVTAAGILLAVLPPRGALLPLVLASLLMGLVQPPALVCARTLWPKVVTDPVLLETTYSVESALTELVFIVGPLLAVAVTGVLGPAEAVAGSGLLAGLGAVGLATSRASRSTHGRRIKRASRAALRSRSVLVLVLTVFAMVVGFAAIDVSTVAAARAHHGNGTAGVMIALWSIGSLIGGFVFGMRSWPGRRSTKIFGFLTAITVLTAVLVPLSNLVAITVVLFASGLYYAPCFSCINQAVQLTALPGAGTESFAWVASGALGGASVGSAAAGFEITQHGVAAGYGVAASGLVVALAIVLIGRRAVRAGDVDAVRAGDVDAVRAGDVDAQAVVSAPDERSPTPVVEIR
jgi:MFS family permease